MLVDLNTQRDFCEENGACPIKNLAQVVPALRSILEWAVRNNVPIISALDSHRRWELNREDVAPHCIDGTAGQRKLDFTVLPSHYMVESDNTLGMPINLFDRHQQVVFRKRTHDLLGNPKADRFLTQLPVAEFILFGNGIENSIKALALGLLTRDKRVSIVLDACGYWNASESDLAVRQTWAKGAALITVEELTRRRLRPRGRCKPYISRNGRAVGSQRPPTVMSPGISPAVLPSPSKVDGSRVGGQPG